MKLAIVGDMHIGVRNDMQCIAEHQAEFFSTFLFPELKTRNIDTIMQMGDLFDKRQYLSLKTMQHFQDSFYTLLEDYNINMTMLLGNHDVLYRNTNYVNSPDLYLTSHERIRVINEPTDIKEFNALVIPWINKENYEDTEKAIANSKSPFCFGHLELAGFDIQQGTVALDGEEPSTFKKFKRVLSGHYHTISEKGNITYTGVPYEMTWNQFNDDCGFWIFDTDTGDLEYIKNPVSMFFKVEYDSQDNSRSWIPYKPEDLSGKFVKVIVTIKDSHYDFDMWIKKIQSYVPQELQIFDNNVSIDGVDFDISDISEGLSNLEIIESKIDAMSDTLYTKEEKNIIKDRMAYLYNEVEL